MPKSLCNGRADARRRAAAAGRPAVRGHEPEWLFEGWGLGGRPASPRDARIALLRMQTADLPVPGRRPRMKRPNPRTDGPRQAERRTADQMTPTSARAAERTEEGDWNERGPLDWQ